jgi:hypothetical protein
LSTETIFIQNNSAIKIAPNLLTLVFSTLLATIPSSGSAAVSNNNVSIQNLLQLNDNIVNKDICSVGRIATEIFTAHLNMAAMLSSLKTILKTDTNQYLSRLADCLSSKEILDNFDACSTMQKDFLYWSLNPDQLTSDNGENDKKAYKLKTKLIGQNPLINEIYSLKVLSVYSLLVYFQDKHFKSSNTSLSRDSSSDELNEQDTDNSIIQFNRCWKSSRYKDLLARKVSLHSFTSILNLPKDFYAILEDIKLGCYPRLYNMTDTSNISNASFKHSFNMLKSLPTSNLSRTINQYELLANENKIVRAKNEARQNPVDPPRFSNPNANTYNSLDDASRENVQRHITNKDMDSVADHKTEQQFNSLNSSNDSNGSNRIQIENRRVKANLCSLSKCEQESDTYQMVLKLKFDDNMNRVLDCSIPTLDIFSSEISADDEKSVPIENPRIAHICFQLTSELIEYGLININDKDLIVNSIKKTFTSCV